MFFLTEIGTAILETARFFRTGIANSLETAEDTATLQGRKG